MSFLEELHISQERTLDHLESIWRRAGPLSAATRNYLPMAIAVRGETSATITDLLRDRVHRYVDVRPYTSQPPTRMEVVASDDNPVSRVDGDRQSTDRNTPLGEPPQLDPLEHRHRHRQ
jgi:hypothetical protein